MRKSNILRVNLGKMDPVEISNELYILQYTALKLEIEP